MQDLAGMLLALFIGFFMGSLAVAPWLGKEILKHRELLLINLITSLAVTFVFVILGAGDMAVPWSAFASFGSVVSLMSRVKKKSFPKLFLAGAPYTSFLLLLLGYPGSIAMVCVTYISSVALGLLIERVAGWRR